jgi:hypothetical protein
MAQPQPLTPVEMADLITNALGFTERDIWRDVAITHEGWHDDSVCAFRLRLANGQEFRIQVEACVPITYQPDKR